MLILRRSDVAAALSGREQAVLDAVADAYRGHDAGESALPHSVFLRFPDRPADRIIGLPAFLGGREPSAGFKWIASFPGNLGAGLERASAVMVLNDLEHGHAEALLEASLISACRTAASAALAAGLLAPAGEATRAAALIGCGVINGQILNFLKARLPELSTVCVFDQAPERATAFARRWEARLPGVEIHPVDSPQQALAAADLVSLATTARQPHLDLDAAQPDAAILHISLRDLTVDAITGSRNVVDDPDHVCRERTSLHLAEQATGGRGFIDTTIGALLRGKTLTPEPGRVVFSPFGLGILDLAVAGDVVAWARAHGRGVSIPDFDA